MPVGEHAGEPAERRESPGCGQQDPVRPHAVGACETRTQTKTFLVGLGPRVGRRMTSLVEVMQSEEACTALSRSFTHT